MGDFLTQDNQSLEQQLSPFVTDRLLKKDIERTSSLPFSITNGAKKTGVVTTEGYWGNALAGDCSFSIDISDLKLNYVPLVLIWRIGATSPKSPTPVTYSGGLIPANTDVGLVYASGSCAYVVTNTSIDFTASSANVGWAYLCYDYFYYAVYYDDSYSGQLGL